MPVIEAICDECRSSRATHVLQMYPQDVPHYYCQACVDSHVPDHASDAKREDFRPMPSRVRDDSIIARMRKKLNGKPVTVSASDMDRLLMLASTAVEIGGGKR